MDKRHRSRLLTSVISWMDKISTRVWICTVLFLIFTYFFLALLPHATILFFSLSTLWDSLSSVCFLYGFFFIYNFFYCLSKTNYDFVCLKRKVQDIYLCSSELSIFIIFINIYVYNYLGIRLTGGNQNSGRVEVFFFGKWGTVCDDYFDNNAAKVVCRMLGKSTWVYIDNHDFL